MTTASETPAMPMPTPIPTPADFPVTWQSPMESMLLWEQEQLHFARPVSPFVGDMLPRIAAVGLGPALAKLGAPISDALWRRINTYVYQTAIPDFSKMEGAEERVKANVAQFGFTMYETWVNELQPQIESFSAEVLGNDYDAMSDSELLVAFHRMLELTQQAWSIHFSLMPGFYTAPAFKHACFEMFGFTGLEAYEMMQGMPNLSVESGSALWRLTQSAPQEVRDIIAGEASETALPKLRALPAAAEFVESFDGYVARYGWRTGEIDVLAPSWVEKPELALDQVRLMLRVDTDPAEDQRRGFARAEALADECRAKLAANPEALGTFNFLLSVARTYPQLQENHNFYLDQKFMATLRRPLTAIGRRLASFGVIEDSDDFAYLVIAEIEAALQGDRTRRQDSVAAHKAEMAHFGQKQPPLALGSMPPMDNPDPFLGDFFGKSKVEAAPQNQLKGTPSSRGSATGTARVITSLADADRVEEGDILVCEMTTPAWTPLFASVAAIVSNSGGPLSHCAVVAREYGVPCVTGTRVATATIPDGATISVDGDTGVIVILG